VAACSTTLSSLDFMKSAPTTELLRLESDPPGAEARTSLGQSCRTPCELTVAAGNELSVTLTLAGYQPQTVAVLAAEGARLAPNPIYAELAPHSGGPARKPGKRKKPATATANPPVQEATSAAAPPPPPMPQTPPEPAVSATNYPWPSR
jgi:hypothetical protein